MTTNLPIAPSGFAGYTRYYENPEYQSAQRWVARTGRGVLILIVVVTISIWAFGVPSGHKGELSTAVALLLGVAFPSGFLYLGLVHFPKARMVNVRRQHEQRMLSHLVESIRNSTNVDSDWRWFGLHNANNSAFFTQDMVGIINLDSDQILYILTNQIRDYRLESSNVGATTQTTVNSTTVGGYGENFLGAYTSSSATSSTEQHYTHVVDLYTVIPGFNHISLYFGPDGAYAKEAYGRLCAMMGPGVRV